MRVVLEPVQALLADRFLVQAAWLTHSSLLRWILKLLPDPKYPITFGIVVPYGVLRSCRIVSIN